VTTYSIGYRVYSMEHTVLNNETGFAVSAHPSRKAAEAVKEELEMNVLWQKNYPELDAAGRKAFYQAVVRPHHWEGYFLFQAIPNRGGGCVEYISKDKDALIAKAEAWLAGEEPEGFYYASL